MVVTGVGFLFMTIHRYENPRFELAKESKKDCTSQ